MNPTEVRKLFIVVGILLLIFFLGLGYLLTKEQTKTSQGISKTTPLSKLKVTKEGDVDADTGVAKAAREAIEKLKPFLPYRESVTVPTGGTITYVMFLPKEAGDYFVTVELAPNIFQYTRAELPKHVLEFREVAKAIYEWVESKGVKKESLLIRWGSEAYQQDEGEQWLKVSNKYPEVVQKDGKYVFK